MVHGSSFVLFPKPPPKKKKTMIDYRDSGLNRNVIKKHLKLLKKTTPSLRVKRKKLPSISKLKKKADLVFSVWIRERDKNQCVLCHKKTDIQCGHLIKRGKMATRYNEMNCHALCSRCNYKDNFEPWHYASWFIFENSDIAYQALINISKGIKQMKRCDYELLIKKYGSNTTKT